MGPLDPAPRRRVLATVAELPSRLLVSLVSVGVIGGLAVAATSVWLSARFGAARRR